MQCEGAAEAIPLTLWPLCSIPVAGRMLRGAQLSIPALGSTQHRTVGLTLCSCGLVHAKMPLLISPRGFQNCVMSEPELSLFGKQVQHLQDKLALEKHTLWVGRRALCFRGSTWRRRQGGG